ncbi:MAG: PilT/PilU family type 4a pilus ATPase [Phycisphaeraceae bacterium]|nr:PilT/PilU family type 4a pilus ATPase [Phycisphaeraceae bacterium]
MTEEALDTDTQDTPDPVADSDEPINLCTGGLSPFFKASIKYEASDLLLRGGQAPKLRLRGSLKALDVDPIDNEDFERWVDEALTPEQEKEYEEKGSLDVGVDLDMPDGSSHRFRINLFRTRGRSAIAARRVSNKILNFEQLHLPPVMGDVAKREQGLILLAGVTGSGKSTTIASMIQHINNNRPCHIVTIEDPIEYLFTDNKAMINQREVGIDVPDFSIGLRALVRENPDVVLIGEMRDRETFEAALQASETGHLVFGTIHASSAAQAFGRIYDLFPPEERDAIRNLLAFQMQAFIYQKLLPTVREDIPRVPGVEILLQAPPTRKMILEGRETELDDVIKNSRDTGMQSFTDSLVDLVERDFIHPKAAQAAATNPDEVKMRLRGINTR